jgi:hypothetical protein
MKTPYDWRNPSAIKKTISRTRLKALNLNEQLNITPQKKTWLGDNFYVM